LVFTTSKRRARRTAIASHNNSIQQMKELILDQD
jgi:hypothetical protein